MIIKDRVQMIETELYALDALEAAPPGVERAFLLGDNNEEQRKH